MFVVVAYDIANDRRRARLRSVLRKYGLPVQESVFECQGTPGAMRRMKREVRRTIRVSVDLVRFYAICADCRDVVEDQEGPVTVETPAAIVAKPILGRRKHR